MQKQKNWRRLALGGGQVVGERPSGGRPSTSPPLRLHLPPVEAGYADAQIDDYGLPTIRHRRHYPWRPGTFLQLRARFSHENGRLQGTAGFGFWNAPFGDPTVRWPALPQAVWFFYASAPGDLPLARSGPGRGWFMATLDATTWRAKALLPLAPVVLLLNQLPPLRRRLWPWLRRRLGISFAPVPLAMTAWHEYRLEWHPDRCLFFGDGDCLLQTPHSPAGPLGFVCWLDNQYLRLTPHGRFGWGVLPVAESQWLEISQLAVGRLP